MKITKFTAAFTLGSLALMALSAGCGSSTPTTASSTDVVAAMFAGLSSFSSTSNSQNSAEFQLTGPLKQPTAFGIAADFMSKNPKSALTPPTTWCGFAAAYPTITFGGMTATYSCTSGVITGSVTMTNLSAKLCTTGATVTVSGSVTDIWNDGNISDGFPGNTKVSFNMKVTGAGFASGGSTIAASFTIVSFAATTFSALFSNSNITGFTCTVDGATWTLATFVAAAQAASCTSTTTSSH